MKKIRQLIVPVIMIVTLAIVSACGGSGSGGSIEDDANEQAALECKVRKAMEEAKQDRENDELRAEVDVLREESKALKQEFRDKYSTEEDKQAFQEALQAAYAELEECEGVNMEGRAKGDRQGKKGQQGERGERGERGDKANRPEADPELVEKYLEDATTLTEMRCEMQLKRIESREDTANTELKEEVDALKKKFDEMKDDILEKVGEEEADKVAFQAASRQARENLEICKKVAELKPKRNKNDKADRGDKPARGERPDKGERPRRERPEKN